MPFRGEANSSFRVSWQTAHRERRAWAPWGNLTTLARPPFLNFGVWITSMGLIAFLPTARGGAFTCPNPLMEAPIPIRQATPISSNRILVRGLKVSSFPRWAPRESRTIWHWDPTVPSHLF